MTARQVPLAEMSDEPTKLLIAGDTHGDYEWIDWLTFVAVEQECDGIVQLGDFGFWPGDGGVTFLDMVEESCADQDLHLWALDGNHDWHPWILEQPVNPDTGFRDVREHVHHIPRGHHWRWNGVRFVGLGGAYSIDRAYRTKYVSWWPEELITQAEANLAAAAGPVDVMLSHDVPNGVDPLCGGTYFDNAADGNRKLLRDVAEATRPSLLLHGHWHNRYTEPLHLDNGWTTHVVGLDMEGTGSRNWEVLKLEKAE